MGTQNMTEGAQDMPPQNMPLWYVDYLELQALEKQHMEGEASSELPLSASKQIFKKEFKPEKYSPLE